MIRISVDATATHKVTSSENARYLKKVEKKVKYIASHSVNDEYTQNLIKQQHLMQTPYNIKKIADTSVQIER